nr:acyltransferase family protein [uncultured Blautia sp.]
MSSSKSQSIPEHPVFFSKNVTNILKGTGIILMLFHHLFSCSSDLVEKYQVSSRLIPMDKIMTISALSKICVAVFVFVSACGITISLSQKSQSQQAGYIWHRYKKLASGFLLVYLISILTFFLRTDRLGVYFKEGPLKGIFYMLIDASGLASFFGTPSYNETWWYMSVAILMIFAMPLLISLYDRFGISAVVVAAMLTYVGIPLTAFTTYLFTMLLGIMAVKEGFYGRLLSLKEKYVSIKSDTVFYALLLAFFAFLFLIILTFRFKCGHEDLTDGFLALILSGIFFILTDLKGFCFPFLSLLGKHSMNMFLLHTLIFEYYFTDFIYSFHNWLLITLVLICTSLAVSAVIDLVKEKLPVF